jgi:hypothetical protein
MARPFEIEPQLTNPFPSPDELRQALTGASRTAREIVVRLWLTEGLPSIFRASPATYEDIRGWLGRRLGIHAKQITIVGSARLGYSLAPAPRFGQPFHPKSDLDLSVVSDELFQRITSAFQIFRADYLAGTVAPRSPHERTLWDHNLSFGERNISRGFFDANKIPNFDRYPVIQLVNQSMWTLLRKLEVTPQAPKVQRASTRVYRDWQAFVDRVSLNLKTAL